MDRAILGLVLCVLSLSCAKANRPTTQPSPQLTQEFQVAPKYTYVLVHGAWAGAWEWKRVGDRLLADGHTVYRPTLTGQGERVHLANPDIDLDTHINDVVNTILFEELKDVVLMGHSYGGMVITGVADRVPDRIKAMVYVDAFLPEDGESLNSARARRASTSAPAGTTAPTTVRLRPTTSGFVNPGGTWPPPPGKLPPYVVPHPAKTLSQPISLKNPVGRSIPTVYILTVDRGRQSEQDTFFRSYERAKNRGWTCWIMEGGHVVNMTHPAELAKLLEKAPGEARAAGPMPATTSASQ